MGHFHVPSISAGAGNGFRPIHTLLLCSRPDTPAVLDLIEEFSPHWGGTCMIGVRINTWPFSRPWMRHAGTSQQTRVRLDSSRLEVLSKMFGKWEHLFWHGWESVAKSTWQSWFQNCCFSFKGGRVVIYCVCHQSDVFSFSTDLCCFLWVHVAPRWDSDAVWTTVKVFEH